MRQLQEGDKIVCCYKLGVYELSLSNAKNEAVNWPWHKSNIVSLHHLMDISHAEPIMDLIAHLLGFELEWVENSDSQLVAVLRKIAP